MRKLKQVTYIPQTSGSGDTLQPHPIGANPINALAIHNTLASYKRDAGKCVAYMQRVGMIPTFHPQKLSAYASAALLYYTSDKAGFGVLHMLTDEVLLAYCESEDAKPKQSRQIADTMCEHPVPDRALAWESHRKRLFPEVADVDTLLAGLTEKQRASLLKKYAAEA